MENKFKVLLIEDSLGDARIFYEFIKEASANEVEITHKLKLSSGLESLAIKVFDVIVLDLDLSDSIGLDTLKKVREKISDIPIIILSGESDRTTAIQAMEYGAQDYIMKGRFEEESLYRTIRFALERKKNEDKLKFYAEELEKSKKLLEEKTLQLNKLNNALTELFKTKDKFHNVSHDLINSLNVLQVYSGTNE